MNLLPTVLPRETDITAHVQQIYARRLEADKMERKDRHVDQLLILLDLALKHGFYDMESLEAVLYYLPSYDLTRKKNYRADQVAEISFYRALKLYFEEGEEEGNFNVKEFKRLLDIASKNGHKAAQGFKGHALYYYNIAIDEDTTEAENDILLAVENGCVGSYISAAEILYERKEFFASHYYCKLGTMYGYVDENHRLCEFPYMLDQKDREIASVPRHLWRPERYIHSLCGMRKRNDVFMWLMINYRKKFFKSMSKYLVYCVCRYLV